MKLLDILQELEKPKQIYAPGKSPSGEPTIADLSPKNREKLFQQGTLMVPLPQDPNRPETVGAKVINLPKIDQVKRDIIKNKREFDAFVYSTNPEIKATAKQINKLHNELFRAMDALGKLLELQKQGRI
jgi:hypothetical protein